MPHQATGVKFLLARTHGFTNYSTGSGKSVMQILLACYLLNHKKVSKVIHVAPKSGCVSVLEDYEKHCTEQPTHIKTLDDLYNFLEKDSYSVGVVQYNLINKAIVYEPSPLKQTIVATMDQRLLDLFKDTRICVTFDEFHTLKNPQAQVTQNWEYLRKHINYCYGFTASTYMKNLYDIYHLCNFLDKTLFRTKTQFTKDFMRVRRKTLYLRSGRRHINEIVGYKNLELLKSRLDNIMCVYQPKLNVVNHIEGTKLADMEDYAIVANGIVNEEEVQHSARLPELQRVVNKDPNKIALFEQTISKLLFQGVIVYCDMYDTVDIVTECLDNMNIGIEYKVINGKLSTKDRKGVKDWFTDDPSHKVLLITQAGGQSLNLQATNQMICYDLPFGVGKFIQIRGRICRQFSEHKEFHIHYLVTDRTIDEYKYSLITQVDEVFDKIFGLSLAPKDSLYTSFNAYIVDKLKQQFLWRSTI